MGQMVFPVNNPQIEFLIDMWPFLSSYVINENKKEVFSIAKHMNHEKESINRFLNFISVENDILKE